MPEIRIGRTISRVRMPMLDTVARADKRIPEIKERERTDMPLNII